MTYLVTGCAGFIGWKVSQLLIEQGHTVFGLDNLSNAYDVRLKQWRLSTLESEPTFTFREADITDQQALAGVFQNHSFDGVVNLAARAGVRYSITDPWIYIETNVVGTLNLLELARKNGIGKFILASSSSLYGQGERPFREDGPTDRALSPYAASKKAAEALCYSYHHTYGLDITVLRYFTVYGPAGRPDMSVFRFIKWIAEGEPLALYGDGTQERDFTYVEDIARGTVLALKPLGHGVINLGNNQPVTVNYVIGLLEGYLGKKARTERGPVHIGDVPATWADISRAQELLGWRPETSLEAGLQQAVEWYQQHRRWAKEIPLP